MLTSAQEASLLALFSRAHTSQRGLSYGPDDWEIKLAAPAKGYMARFVLNTKRTDDFLRLLINVRELSHNNVGTFYFSQLQNSAPGKLDDVWVADATLDKLEYAWLGRLVRSIAFTEQVVNPDLKMYLEENVHLTYENGVAVLYEDL